VFNETPKDGLPIRVFVKGYSTTKKNVLGVIKNLSLCHILNTPVTGMASIVVLGFTNFVKEVYGGCKNSFKKMRSTTQSAWV
jgi:hypothetical protein